MKKRRCERLSLLLAVVVGVGMLCGIVGCKNNDPVQPSPETGKGETVITLGDEMPEAETVNGCGRLLTAIQSSDEESVGCEYWKVRECSEEEQSKGNRFETDYFTFGEPISKNGDYALKIKEGVTLPKNLYLGWLFCFREITKGKYSDAVTGYYIPEGTFEGRREIETVSMPQRHGTYAKQLFANCISLKKVYLRVFETWLYEDVFPSISPPTGLRGYYYHISSRMFLNCVSLEEVSFTGETYDATGGICVFEEGFMNCISLKKITFPGYLAYFKGNINYENVTSVAICGDNAFKNCINFDPADQDQLIYKNEYAYELEPEF